MWAVTSGTGTSLPATTTPAWWSHCDHDSEKRCHPPTESYQSASPCALCLSHFISPKPSGRDRREPILRARQLSALGSWHAAAPKLKPQALNHFAVLLFPHTFTVQGSWHFHSNFLVTAGTCSPQKSDLPKATYGELEPRWGPLVPAPCQCPRGCSPGLKAHPDGVFKGGSAPQPRGQRNL